VFGAPETKHRQHDAKPKYNPEGNMIFQSILITLLVGLTIALANHLLSNTREKRKERREAGRLVANAFRAELDALLQTDTDARHILMDEAYLRHESAVRHFMPKLSWINRLRLHWAWRALAHHQKDKKCQIPFYEQYADCGSLTKRRNVRPFAIKRIQHIISLTQK